MEEAGCRWERPRQCLAAGAAGKEVLREDKAEQGGAGMVVEWCANSGLQMGVGPPTGNGSASLCFLATSIKSHPWAMQCFHCWHCYWSLFPKCPWNHFSCYFAGCCPQNGCPSVSLCSVTTPSRLSCLSVSRCMQSSKRNHPLQAALLPRLGKRSWICVSWEEPDGALQRGAAAGQLFWGARQSSRQQRWRSGCRQRCRGRVLQEPACPGGSSQEPPAPSASLGGDNKAEAIVNRRPRF